VIINPGVAISHIVSGSIQNTTPLSPWGGGEHIDLVQGAKASRFTLLPGFDWIDADFLARLVLVFESNQAVGKREKSIVPAHPDMVSGMKMCAQLANYDIAGAHEFTAEFLYAPALSGAVATISGTSARFFMCHYFPPKTQSCRD
jgi:hypothetical protein